MHDKIIYYIIMDINELDEGVKFCYKCKKINKKDSSVSEKYISVDNKRVCYFNSSKTRYNKINIKSIVNVRYGPSTEIFKKFGNSNKYKPQLCFSIITLKRTYDFIGENFSDTCFIVKTINRYLEFNKMDENILEGLFNVLNGMNPDNIQNGNFTETITDIMQSLNK